jgi:hypothetical protein
LANRDSAGFAVANLVLNPWLLSYRIFTVATDAFGCRFSSELALIESPSERLWQRLLLNSGGVKKPENLNRMDPLNNSVVD